MDPKYPRPRVMLPQSVRVFDGNLWFSAELWAQNYAEQMKAYPTPPNPTRAARLWESARGKCDSRTVRIPCLPTNFLSLSNGTVDFGAPFLCRIPRIYNILISCRPVTFEASEIKKREQRLHKDGIFLKSTSGDYIQHASRSPRTKSVWDYFPSIFFELRQIS